MYIGWDGLISRGNNLIKDAVVACQGNCFLLSYSVSPVQREFLLN